MHGKTSVITHDGRGVFAGLPDPLVATRYHSLVVDADAVPPALEVSARSEDGTVMGLRHRTLAVEGVQFHPESILTEGGHRLLANWLALVRPARTPTPPFLQAEAGLPGRALTAVGDRPLDGPGPDGWRGRRRYVVDGRGTVVVVVGAASWSWWRARWWSSGPV